MVPHVKNVILASADQVAIDAVAARLMGFDPLSIKFIRMAHDMGLGCGDPAEIEIVGDPVASGESWHFDGPYKEMTFASRNQHRIYWGPLKGPVEWSLKTWMAPWAYIASVIYHDMYWYPRNGNERVLDVLNSDWGRLFHNWERLTPDERGWTELGEPPHGYKRDTPALLRKGAGLVWGALKESPEVAHRLHRRAQGRADDGTCGGR
jgi:hypothetical protein